MKNKEMNKVVVIFKRFERFWHWGQAALILLLILTGLEAHGLFYLFGFGSAIELHNIAGFIWAGLIVLIFTWIFTTGEWRQYTPSLKNVDSTLRFYLYGVFVGEKHPHHMTPENKFNPLQRLGYLVIIFGLLPLQVITGICFYFFPELRAYSVIDQIDLIAILHTVNAYALLSFLVIHLYMITFGKKLSSHIRVMITGKEQIKE